MIDEESGVVPGKQNRAKYSNEYEVNMASNLMIKNVVLMTDKYDEI